ncbi:MAG: hypothetical protein JXA21_17145 [Anaerolineae bacterium]|nr:hypothetical protein [Anaerolineae bacterium]
MAQHTELGAWGEAVVLAMFRDAGIEAAYGRPADIVIAGGVPVEVKTAKLSHYNGRRMGFQFCIDRQGHTSLKGVAVVLVCAGDDGEAHFFIIPAHVVGNRRKVAIGPDPVQYRGKWAAFLNRWEAIAEVA